VSLQTVQETCVRIFEVAPPPKAQPAVRACTDCRKMFLPPKSTIAACAECREQRRVDAQAVFVPPARIRCEDCRFGQAEPRSDTGWVCKVSLAMTCKPWMYAHHFKARE
jgi:hypothetical protein